jgi:integrase
MDCRSWRFLTRCFHGGYFFDRGSTDLMNETKRSRLTKRVVDDAEKASDPYFIWDADLTGFGLRVATSGKKSFLAQFRVGHGRGARQRRITLGPYGDLTVEQARRKAQELISGARLGEDLTQTLRTKADEAITVRKLCEMWSEEGAHVDRRTGRRRSAKRVAEDVARLEAHVYPTLGRLRLSEIRRKDLERARDAIAKGLTAKRTKTRLRGVQQIKGGTGTATRTLRLLSSVFAYGVDHEYLTDNPMRGVKLAASKKRERFLSGSEIAKLGEVLAELEEEGCNPNGPNVIRLLALTGARLGEIESLRWQDVDFEHSLIRLPDSKTGAKSFPLAPAALQLLSNLNEVREYKWVFPGARGDGHFVGTGKFWRLVRERTELDGVRLHDLRHTFASFGASAGYGLPVIGAILGHTQASTTQRYAHLANDPVHQAATNIATEIATHLGSSNKRGVHRG